MRLPIFVVITLSLALAAAAGCDDDSAGLDQPASYSVPLQRGAYWPKFRRTANGSGYSPRQPGFAQKDVWSFDTGKGIFSSPVIDKDGTIYIGSANAKFYALRADGTVKWHKQLGELVDSSAVIGADGTVYVGSGDGNLYAFAADGSIRWKFQPRGGAFITWFEGNVVMGRDGTLYAGNDDFHMYAVDPQTGKEKWAYKVGDQIWSAAAVGPDGALYFGSNDLTLHSIDPKIAAVDPDNAQTKAVRWKFAGKGSMVSSPLVTKDGIVVTGSFDGFAYGIDAKTGKKLWSLPTREHIYASPAQGPDGTVYIPGADGTLYALDPKTGAVKWTFDILDPIRSSPAIDGNGTIYFGAGDGRLYAVNPDGTRRWSFDTSSSDRNDLNASPALGKDAIIIAGEEGKVWSIPYDYCLLAADDQRCNTSKSEDVGVDGSTVYFLTPGGASLADPPAAGIAPGESVALRLVVRQDGDTVDAAIDPTSLSVKLTPPTPHTIDVAADGSFLVIVPVASFEENTSYSVRVRGDFLTGGKRNGNRVVGGKRTGAFGRTLSINTRQRALHTFPLPTSGDSVPVLNLSRLAAPNPTLLPSYNQIGFDFMNLLIGVIEHDKDSGRAMAWVVAGTRDHSNNVIVDSSSEQRILFPMVGTIRGSELVLESSSFVVEFGGVSAPLERLRLGGSLDKDGNSTALSVFASTTCSKVEFYGVLLQVAGLCNPISDQMIVNGTALLSAIKRGGERPVELTASEPIVTAPTPKQGSTDAVDGSISVTLGGPLPGTDHVVSLLVLAADGTPMKLPYSTGTKNERDDVGRITRVTLSTGQSSIPAGSTIVVLHDVFPLARFTTQ